MIINLVHISCKLHVHVSTVNETASNIGDFPIRPEPVRMTSR